MDNLNLDWTGNLEELPSFQERITKINLAKSLQTPEQAEGIRARNKYAKTPAYKKTVAFAKKHEGKKVTLGGDKEVGRILGPNYYMHGDSKYANHVWVKTPISGKIPIHHKDVKFVDKDHDSEVPSFSGNHYKKVGQNIVFTNKYKKHLEKVEKLKNVPAYQKTKAFKEADKNTKEYFTKLNKERKNRKPAGFSGHDVTPEMRKLLDLHNKLSAKHEMHQRASEMHEIKGRPQLAQEHKKKANKFHSLMRETMQRVKAADPRYNKDIDEACGSSKRVFKKKADNCQIYDPRLLLYIRNSEAQDFDDSVIGEGAAEWLEKKITSQKKKTYSYLPPKKVKESITANDIDEMVNDPAWHVHQSMAHVKRASDAPNPGVKKFHIKMAQYHKDRIKSIRAEGVKQV